MTPEFLIDRCLGQKFPTTLEGAGYLLHRFEDHFQHDTPDMQWLGEAGRRGWFVITGDKRILCRASERRAAIESGVGLFVLVSKVPFAQLAQGLIALQPAIARFIDRHPRPFMAKVYCPGADDGRGNMKGRISLYVQDR